MAMVM
jgi:hypothetical protein